MKPWRVMFLLMVGNWSGRAHADFGYLAAVALLMMGVGIHYWLESRATPTVQGVQDD